MRQRYFVAHLLATPVATYHEELVHELAKKFKLKVGSGIFPTHITLKAPFKATSDFMHEGLIKELKTIPSLTWSSHEPIMHLHIALAKKDIEPKFDEVWEYLKQKSTPAFHRSLDNIALLRFENSVWVIDSFYPIALLSR